MVLIHICIVGDGMVAMITHIVSEISNCPLPYRGNFQETKFLRISYLTLVLYETS